MRSTPSVNPAPIFFFHFFRNHANYVLSRLDERGERVVTNVRRACDGRGWRRRTSGAIADGENVWFWRPDAGAKFAMMLRSTRMTGARKPGPREEHGISVNTIAQGMPVISAEPVVTAACYL
jgi:hypothetical protein